MHVDFVSGDTGSKLVVTCKDKDTKQAINLTGATVTLKWRISEAPLQTRAMTIVNAAAGVVEYLFQADELSVGRISGEVEIADSNGRRLTQVEPFSLLVREKL